MAGGPIIGETLRQRMSMLGHSPLAGGTGVGLTRARTNEFASARVTEQGGSAGDARRTRPSVFGTGVPGVRQTNAPMTRMSVRFEHPDHQLFSRITGKKSSKGGTEIDLDDLSESSQTFKAGNTRLQQSYLAKLLYSQEFEMFVGFVILGNFVIIAIETETRGQLTREQEGSASYDALLSQLMIMYYANIGLLMFYMVEVGARLWLQRMYFFQHRWNVFDFVIVICGIIGQGLETAANMSGMNMENMSLLRIMRMMRLLRVSRVLLSFPLLYSLVSGLTNCMKTLVLAAGLTFMVLTMWAIIAVEYMQPLLPAIDAAGYYEGCDWCPHAFETILKSDLTFFQVISGDGWSHLARPLIEKHPWTGAIFVCVIFTMVFGLLNLITAVIVDTAAQARESDITNLAKKKSVDRDIAWHCFNDFCHALDKDGSGDIDVEELQEGMEEIPELKNCLTVMGVEEEDLADLFEILDEDGNGVLTHQEFASQLYKLKTMEPQTTLFFVKEILDDMRRRVNNVELQTWQMAQQDRLGLGGDSCKAAATTSQGLKVEPPKTVRKSCYVTGIKACRKHHPVAVDDEVEASPKNGKDDGSNSKGTKSVNSLASSGLKGVMRHKPGGTSSRYTRKIHKDQPTSKGLSSKKTQIVSLPKETLIVPGCINGLAADEASTEELVPLPGKTRSSRNQEAVVVVLPEAEVDLEAEPVHEDDATSDISGPCHRIPQHDNAVDEDEVATASSSSPQVSSAQTPKFGSMMSTPSTLQDPLTNVSVVPEIGSPVSDLRSPVSELQEVTSSAISEPDVHIPSSISDPGLPLRREEPREKPQPSPVILRTSVKHQEEEDCDVWDEDELVFDGSPQQGDSGGKSPSLSSSPRQAPVGFATSFVD